VTSVGAREKLLASVVVGAKIKSIIYSEEKGYLCVGLQTGTVHVYMISISDLLQGKSLATDIVQENSQSLYRRHLLR